jgi:uncharacterized cofD-like protein
MSNQRLRRLKFARWLAPGLGIKRWLFSIFVGIMSITLGMTFIISELSLLENMSFVQVWDEALIAVGAGIALITLALVKLSQNILAPYRQHQQGDVVDLMQAHNRRKRGVRLVALGGGTGLPAVLRGLKHYTSNITAIVTMADNGGSSGRLRRELGVLPPGDLRNNIAALADDENLMTRLFQYRFSNGDLGGHAFGNLFIAALAGVTGSLEEALNETERVLNIQGRVLPSTVEDVNLSATVDVNGQTLTIQGEEQISAAGGHIQDIALLPANAHAYEHSVQAIIDADIVVIGPGSLYTSILPNLLVKGIANALRATNAHRVYVCNVATQPGETDNYSVAEHVLALESHVGRGVFQTVLANNAYPTLNAGVNTHYVEPAPEHHEIFQRYDVRYVDLTDVARPWRHDPQKLARAIQAILTEEGRIRGAKPAYDSNKPLTTI